MKKRFLDLPLRIKIASLNFFIILLVTIFLAGSFYHLYKENAVDEIGNYQVKNAEFIRNNIELIEDTIESLSTNLMLNENFQGLLRLPAFQVKNPNANYVNMNTSLNLALNTLVSNDYISYISIYTRNGFSFYHSKFNKRNALLNIKGSPDYEKMDDLEGGPYWTTYAEDSGFFVADKSGPKLTMLRAIIDLNSYTVQGFMVICVDWNTIWSYVPNAGNNAYLLADGTGRPLSVDTAYAPVLDAARREDLTLSGFFPLPDKSVVRLDGEEYLFANSGISTSNFYVLSLMPMRFVMQDVNRGMVLFLFLALFCLLFSLFASVFTASLVTKPVKKLIGAIRSAKSGNFKSKVNFIYQDEIGELGAEYNQMVDELNLLFTRVLNLEIRNRDSEIRAMQAQINPHFLYNTLDSIYLKALNANQEVADMIYSLSRILRLTLNRGGDLTTVRDEKSFMENYLLLQKIRFKDRFDYEFRVDPSLLGRNIPKLVLQPFVENAIVHGLDSIGRRLHIVIEGSCREGALDFAIRDNGCGIEPELLDRILNGSEKPDEGQTRGFAIRNVKERLRLYYGASKDFRFGISSIPGEGTAVEIRIPEGRPEHVSASDRR